MSNEHERFYATPRRVGRVEVWHADDGWWVRLVGKDGPWRPASSSLVALARQYATFKQRGEQWQHTK